MTTPVQPQGSGTGTSDPYLMESYENLVWAQENINGAYASFKQVCDIDASPSITEGFRGIESDGMYDGQGFKIYNFAPGIEGGSGALFYQNFGIIRNLKVEVVDTELSDKSGSMAPLVFTNLGDIDFCEVSGTLNNTFARVGGLVYNSWGKSIRNCKCSININDSTTTFAGLAYSCNSNSGIFRSVYTGTELSSAGMYPIAKVVDDDASFVTVFWNKDHVNISSSDYGTGLTDDQMADRAMFENQGFDFPTDWFIDNKDEPSLSVFENRYEPIQPAGDGSAENPYEIGSFSNLMWVFTPHNKPDLSKNYVLTNDIDATPSRSTLMYSVGDTNTPFTGTFDGQGYVIKNLEINSDFGSGHDQGFFYEMDSNNPATIRNLGINYLGVHNLNSYTDFNFGGICSNNEGLIENCFVTGVIEKSREIGGLVYSNNGTLKNCYVEAEIDSTNGGHHGHIGGIATRLGEFSITENCYSSCIIHADTGLYGGHVSQICPFGDSEAVFNNCYYNQDAEIFGEQVITDEGTGLTEEEMKDESNFTGWDFTDTWYMDTQSGGYPALQVFSRLQTENQLGIKILIGKKDNWTPPLPIGESDSGYCFSLTTPVTGYADYSDRLLKINPILNQTVFMEKTKKTKTSSHGIGGLSEMKDTSFSFVFTGNAAEFIGCRVTIVKNGTDMFKGDIYDVLQEGDKTTAKARGLLYSTDVNISKEVEDDEDGTVVIGGERFVKLKKWQDEVGNNFLIKGDYSIQDIYIKKETDNEDGEEKLTGEDFIKVKTPWEVRDSKIYFEESFTGSNKLIGSISKIDSGVYEAVLDDYAIIGFVSDDELPSECTAGSSVSGLVGNNKITYWREGTAFKYGKTFQVFKTNSVGAFEPVLEKILSEGLKTVDGSHSVSNYYIFSSTHIKMGMNYHRELTSIVDQLEGRFYSRTRINDKPLFSDYGIPVNSYVERQTLINESGEEFSILGVFPEVGSPNTRVIFTGIDLEEYPSFMKFKVKRDTLSKQFVSVMLEGGISHDNIVSLDGKSKCSKGSFDSFVFSSNFWSVIEAGFNGSDYEVRFLSHASDDPSSFFTHAGVTVDYNSGTSRATKEALISSMLVKHTLPKVKGNILDIRLKKGGLTWYGANVDYPLVNTIDYTKYHATFQWYLGFQAPSLLSSEAFKTGFNGKITEHRLDSSPVVQIDWDEVWPTDSEGWLGEEFPKTLEGLADKNIMFSTMITGFLKDRNYHPYERTQVGLKPYILLDNRFSIKVAGEVSVENGEFYAKTSFPTEGVTEEDVVLTYTLTSHTRQPIDKFYTYIKGATYYSIYQSGDSFKFTEFEGGEDTVVKDEGTIIEEWFNNSLGVVSDYGFYTEGHGLIKIGNIYEEFPEPLSVLSNFYSSPVEIIPTPNVLLPLKGLKDHFYKYLPPETEDHYGVVKVYKRKESYFSPDNPAVVCKNILEKYLNSEIDSDSFTITAEARKGWKCSVKVTDKTPATDVLDRVARENMILIVEDSDGAILMYPVEYKEPSWRIKEDVIKLEYPKVTYTGSNYLITGMDVDYATGKIDSGDLPQEPFTVAKSFTGKDKEISLTLDSVMDKTSALNSSNIKQLFHTKPIAQIEVDLWEDENVKVGSWGNYRNSDNIFLCVKCKNDLIKNTQKVTLFEFDVNLFVDTYMEVPEDADLWEEDTDEGDEYEEIL